MEQVWKKLREVQFFLLKLTERVTLSFGDHDQCDFYLSAILSAGRSVDYRLSKLFQKPYGKFHEEWRARLSNDDETLFKFMIDDRNEEVHAAGSSRGQEQLRIPVRGGISDKSGTLTISHSMPLVPGFLPMIVKPSFYFDIDGRHAPVVEACSTYARLLEELVAAWAESNPQQMSGCGPR